MCRDYPVTGFHSQADAEHRANVTARAAWANPDALVRPLWSPENLAAFRRAFGRTPFSAGGVYPTTTELNPRVMVTSWA